MKQTTYTSVTPLQPKAFFTGIWKGEGKLCPHPFVRWLVPEQHIRFESQSIWLSETVWMVKEKFEFSSGTVIARTMFVEQVAPECLHVTADDMPLGADILLDEKGFRFTPYYISAQYKDRRWQLRCFDENVIDENGVIDDTIEMFFWGLHVATMSLSVHRMES